MVQKYNKKTSQTMKSMIGLLAFLSKMMRMSLIDFNMRRMKQKLKFPKLSHYFKNRIIVSQIENVITIQYVYKKSNSNKHFIYLHGGAYVFKGEGMHFGFLKYFNSKLQGKITFIDYPLAPKSKYDNTVKVTTNMIKQIILSNPEDEFYLIGDSAGAGLALVVQKKLLDQEVGKTPNKLFLFSPWVDLTSSNPLIDEYSNRDFILSKKALILAASMYTNNPEDELVSPLYQDSSNISGIHIYSGTRDMLHPDIIKFEQKNPHAHLTIFEGLPHVFPVFGKTKERKYVVEDILNHL